MRKIFTALFSLLLMSSVVYAQDLFIRNDKYSTEVFIKMDPKLISSVKKLDNAVLINFKKNLKEPFVRTLDDKYISSVEAKANQFIINIKPDTEFSVLNDVSGVKVMATKSKTTTDILSSYGIGKPLLTATSTVVEDKAQEESLNNAERLITERNFPAAAKILNEILQSSKNDFYRQEAFYRLGQTYLLMAESDPNFFADAAQTFDDFARLYPDNFRAGDALFKSAESKETVSQLFEAIFTYKKIYDSVPDLESKRIALLKVADLYNKVGQTDNAIDSFKTYTKTFKSDAEKAYASLAQIYFDLREYDMAFEEYVNLPIDQFINNPEVTPRQIHSMAKTFALKNRPDDALKLYKNIYEKHSDSEYTNDAIAKSAEILASLNRMEDSDKLLLQLKELFPNLKTGQAAAIQYATKYLKTKPYKFWQDFFKDTLQGEDTHLLNSEAEYLLLQSLYAEDKNAILPEAQKFLDKYPISPKFDEVNKIREEFVFANLKTLFENKEYDELEPKLATFKSEYPETTYSAEIKTMEDDLTFRKVLALYAQNKFKETINTVEDHIITEPTDPEIDKWFDLLDDAYYKNMEKFITAANYPSVRAAARQYLTILPNGKSKEAVISQLRTAFERPFITTYAAADYATLVKTYDDNIDWLKNYIDNAEHDKYKVMLGIAAYKLGSTNKAQSIYASITPNQEPDYILLGLLLNDQNQYAKISTLDEDNFKYLISELETTDVDVALKLLKQYNQNTALATKLEYDIAKNISSDAKRETIIMDIYDTLRSDKKSRFEGSDDVTLDVGTLYFKKNDFSSAILALREYLDNTKEVNDKKAEAYYYMGKSYINMNDTDRGYQYYNELIELIPDSIFAGIAKGEMEEGNWKKTINGLQ